MKSKNVFFKFVKKTWAVLFAILLFGSCSGDANKYGLVPEDSRNIEYLAFNPYGDKEANAIVFRLIQMRLMENVALVDGKYSLRHTSAHDLMIEEKAYAVCSDYVLWTLNSSNYKQNLLTRSIPTELENIADEQDLHSLVSWVSNHVNANTARFFSHYIFGNGQDYCLSSSDWDFVKNHSASQLPNMCSGSSHVIINNRRYYYGVVRFYDTEYAYAFGDATVFCSSDTTSVGFYDRYDFNAGTRVECDEDIVSLIRCLPFGHNYDIYYGIHCKPMW